MEHISPSPSVEVWCGIVLDQIVGPFFHESIFMGAVY
jgi:hypothetical protein